MIRLFARELDKGKGLSKPSPYYIALPLIRPLLDSRAESPPTGQDRLGNETENWPLMKVDKAKVLSS